MARQNDPELSRTIRWPLALTHAGLVAERVVRAWWPLWSVVFVALAILMLGLQDLVAVEWVWAVGAGLTALFIWALWRGMRVFQWPSRDEALLRLDGSLKGNPIQAALDSPAIGTGDAASMAVWNAHQARMRARLKEAKPVEPDLRVSNADPYALRFVALLALSVAFLFGSFVRVQSVTNMGVGGPELAQGPSWEGWMSPPGYTRLPTVYLNDITAENLDVPEGALITLRMYGEVGALSLDESVSGLSRTPEQAQDTAQDFEVAQAGRLAIDGPNGRAWQIAMIPDAAPRIERDGEIEVAYDGAAQIPFKAQDDFGIEAGQARLVLALGEVDRRYGRALEPEFQEVINVPLPMPLAGSRADFKEALGGNFSLHPWANLPVRLEMSVTDGRGQTARTEPELITLPGRRFFDPMAKAVIEQRQALLWNRDNVDTISQLLRAMSNRPDEIFRKPEPRKTLSEILAKLEALDGISDEQQGELAQALWDLAVELEEGDLQDALERLQRAQERLEEAMKNGASDQEIAELMQELREATQDYMRELARQNRQNEEPGEPADPENTIEMSQDDLQRMMDRIQELMEQGRMAEAMEALQQLQEMMENMQVTQGEGGQSPGEQAMDQLSDTLREQQELSDEAFRDLQEQFNPSQRQDGQQPSQQEGDPGGEPGDQQPGQGEARERGDGQGQGEQGLEQSLADRQQALRDELNRQRRNLPGQGTEAGERSAQSLEDADNAMDGAEEALRDGDLAEAIDQQSEAMEALRDGMRALGEAMAQQRAQQQGQQGFAEGGEPGEQRDPLGRSQGNSGRSDTDEGLLQGEDVYRRAEELLDEIRRRSSEADRPEIEKNYLDRLLERF
ncbi:TIGR02302 family protein [uncultured Pelagimonas sp.]|uniref:TIGR02302 family protein n=1 Tax=uncultured Pelagimonas sp. TaxID=1618102 RepID=UPI0026097504|nr:TIGR02302 family protein [uncultured Pelagimonas sp.]